LFRPAEKRRRDEPGVDQDPVAMLPTQIGRALQELDIVWIPAHSPQAKGRVERGFSTAQDRLVKGLRVAGVRTLEQANMYLERQFLSASFCLGGIASLPWHRRIPATLIGSSPLQITWPPF
jgi:hypothetical protein